jgi:Domain of unknown function (DUF5655)
MVNKKELIAYFYEMWTCPLCRQRFVNTNQVHSCGDKVLADFLKDKSELTVSLFWYFTRQYQQIGDVTVHPTKSMIALAAKTRFAYVTRLGKNFIDVVFPFKEPCHDNLCFHKIAQVPGSGQFNHHFRMCSEDDINEEVLYFMKRAYETGL